MTENEISKVVVDICYHLHKAYGPGLFETVYEEMICYELKKRNIPFSVSLDLRFGMMAGIWVLGSGQIW